MSSAIDVATASAAALALGLALGALTGIPLGVINLAILDAALAGRRRFARGLGVGGATADTLHAALAFVGVAHVITGHPLRVRILAVVAAAAIIGYALLARRRAKAAVVDHGDHLGRGALTGFLLTLPNPGALTAWVAIAAALAPDATLTAGLATALGVGLGSAAWFTALASWLARAPREHRALRIVPKIAGALLIGIAIVGVVRAW